MSVNAEMMLTFFFFFLAEFGLTEEQFAKGIEHLAEVQTREIEVVPMNSSPWSPLFYANVFFFDRFSVHLFSHEKCRGCWRRSMPPAIILCSAIS